MDDKTLVERLMEFENFIRGHGPMEGAWFGDTRSDIKGAFWWRRLSPIKEAADTIEALQSRIEALEADNARARAQGQDEGFAAAVQELRDMSARKPLPTLWHAASALADSLEQSRIPCQALEGSGND